MSKRDETSDLIGMLLRPDGMGNELFRMTSQHYTRVVDIGFICAKCGRTLHGQQASYPEMPHIETKAVAYCPTCEEVRVND